LSYPLFIVRREGEIICKTRDIVTQEMRGFALRVLSGFRCGSGKLLEAG